MTTGICEHYIRDAQGNLMATYRHELLPIGPPEPGTEASLKLIERPIYGSSRLGVDAHALELGGLRAEDPNPYLLDNPIGKVHYELTDHLGNVATVVTDELIGVDVDDDGSAPEYFQPFVVSAQGYEPFGALLLGRNFSSSSYNFGFQGQIKDDEINGAVGTSYAFEYRLHDPRVGRFWSIDPLAAKYPWNSPYAFAENKVIQFVELEGLETGSTTISGQDPSNSGWQYGPNNPNEGPILEALDAVVAKGKSIMEGVGQWWDEADMSLSAEGRLGIGSGGDSHGISFGSTNYFAGGKAVIQAGDPRPGLPQVGNTRLNYSAVQPSQTEFHVGIEGEGSSGTTTITAARDNCTGATTVQITTQVKVARLVVERTHVVHCTPATCNNSIETPASMSTASATFVGFEFFSGEARTPRPAGVVGNYQIMAGYTNQAVPENVWR